MNYQEMSDHEISCEVGSRISLADYLMVVNCQRDYCNSWADAGPIIQRCKISLIHDGVAEPQDGGCWLARPTYGYDHEKARSDNPLRAVMIVFLMMKGGE